jgi:hypothetical protein
MRELRKAVHAADRAQRLVTPWNFSISALAGFLEATDFCADYFAGRQDQAAQMRRFIDSILSRNAAHFRSSMPFLVPQDIRNQWQDWAEQFGLVLGGRQPTTSFGRPATTNRPSAATAVATVGQSSQPEPPRNICRRFNSAAGCPTSGPNCVLTTRAGRRITLMHMCTAPIGGSAFCLKPGHSLPEHK